MKVLIVDNYDSFTYNLFHYVEKCDVNVIVKRNDEIDIVEVNQYDKIILSPGPGLPSETNLMFDILRDYSGSKSILGVCLGMQGIAEFFGGKLINQAKVKHGVAVDVKVDSESILYKGVPSEFKVGLYHSWCVDEMSLPESLEITGVSEEGVVMSIQHKTLPVFGVQFHPESIMTEHGLAIIRNFLNN